MEKMNLGVGIRAALSTGAATNRFLIVNTLVFSLPERYFPFPRNGELYRFVR